MEQIILALEREKSCWQVKEILESSGTASCRIWYLCCPGTPDGQQISHHDSRVQL